MGELAAHIVECVEVYATAVAGDRQLGVDPVDPGDFGARLSVALAALTAAWGSDETDLVVMGRSMPRETAGWVVVCELLVHTHDLTRGGSGAGSCPPEVLDLAVRARMAAPTFVDTYRTTGTIGPAQAPPEDADALDFLAAFFGRRLPHSARQ